MSNKFINCPHCDIYVEVLELNCKIFRCGILKNTLKQIDPHLCKIECEKLVNNNEIYGCGKPFRVDIIDNEYISYVCDYI